jgi:hypothetical protein
VASESRGPHAVAAGGREYAAEQVLEAYERGVADGREAEREGGAPHPAAVLFGWLTSLAICSVVLSATVWAVVHLWRAVL